METKRLSKDQIEKLDEKVLSLITRFSKRMTLVQTWRLDGELGANTPGQLDHSLRRLKAKGLIHSGRRGGWLLGPAGKLEADVKAATVGPEDGSITIPVVEKVEPPAGDAA